MIDLFAGQKPVVLTLWSRIRVIINKKNKNPTGIG